MLMRYSDLNPEFGVNFSIESPLEIQCMSCDSEEKLTPNFKLISDYLTCVELRDNFY